MILLPLQMNQKIESKVWILFLLGTLLAHYAWEIAQAQLFSEHRGQALSRYAIHCFWAALGDVLISGFSFLTATLWDRGTQWVYRCKFATAECLWVGTGISVTAIFEILATRSGRWTYSSDMPAVFGIGLAPLLEWLIIPPLSLCILRAGLNRNHDPA